MRIVNIKIENFRLLESIELNVEGDSTLIIGRNNSGKTSFFEILKMLTSKGEDDISFEDFSQSSYQIFKDTLAIYEKSIVEGILEQDKIGLEDEVRKNIPKIRLVIEIEYDKKNDSLVNLSQFIMDLDSAKNEAFIEISYLPIDSLRLFNSFLNREDKDVELITFLHQNIKNFYRLKCFASENLEGNKRKREIEGSYRDKIRKVVSFEDIKALRILDDKKGDRNNTLAQGFSKYYNERDESNEDVKNLEAALEKVESDLKDKYQVVLTKILDDLKKFGANTPITIPAININSKFDSEDVIKRNIQYFYKHDEIDLPESYNGLGYSNLIYMILELASFIEKFKNAKREKVSEFLMVMIEEPEAHMHPQMQQVFISNVKGVLEEAKKEGIEVQLILTTHSSHIISEAGIDNTKGFKRIRYFNKIDGKIESQDFNKLEIESEKHTFRFLKQYLTLHKCDLFFADKVILVEGVTERMLLPQMILKSTPRLLSEYITILEVGGAYTHKFKDLLKFIGVKTLVITDLDSIDATSREKCPVNNGANNEKTSNQTLIKWLPKKENVSELLACSKSDKIEDEIVMIAFQTKEEEGGNTARSFEEAFFICNNNLIIGKTKVVEDDEEKEVENKDAFSILRSKTIEDIKANSEYKLLEKMSSKDKTNFAFDVLSFDEQTYGEWKTPKYIKEGLEWLASNQLTTVSG